MPRIGIPSRRRASTCALPTKPTPITAAVWFIALAPGDALALASSSRNGTREAVCVPECAGGKVPVFGPRGNGSYFGQMGLQARDIKAAGSGQLVAIALSLPMLGLRPAPV